MEDRQKRLAIITKFILDSPEGQNFELIQKAFCFLDQNFNDIKSGDNFLNAAKTIAYLCSINNLDIPFIDIAKMVKENENPDFNHSVLRDFEYEMESKNKLYKIKINLKTPSDYIIPENILAQKISTIMMTSKKYFDNPEPKKVAYSSLGLAQLQNSEECTYPIENFFDEGCDIFVEKLGSNDFSKILEKCKMQFLEEFKCSNDLDIQNSNKLQKEISSVVPELMKLIKQKSDKIVHFMNESKKFCSLLKNETYKLGKLLGKGNDGEAYILEGPGYNSPVVIKQYNTVKDRARIEIEIHAILSSINHPNVLKLYSFLKCKKTYYSIIEQLDGNLFHVPKTYKYDLFFQVFYALVSLQKIFKFNHYDLHFGNLFYKKVESETIKYTVGENTYLVPNHGFLVKIADFGFSRVEYPSGNIISDNKDDDSFNRTKKYNPMFEICSLGHFLNPVQNAMKGYLNGDEKEERVPMKKNYECEWKSKGEWHHILNSDDLEVKDILPILYHKYINNSSPGVEIDFEGLAEVISENDAYVVT